MAGNRMKKIVYYIGEFRFPEGGANALRVLGNAKALQLYGYDVRIIGTQICKNQAAININDVSLSHTFRGLQYGILQPKQWSSFSFVIKVIHFIFSGIRLANYLRRHINHETAAIICTAGGQLRFFPFLMNLCVKHRIPLICDSMEWYDPTHMPLGSLGLFRIEHEICMKFLFPKIGNIIAISSLLKDHYVKCGCTVVRVPPLTDVLDEKWNSARSYTSSYKLRLSFVGNAGKKDLIVNAIRGIALLGHDVENCEMLIVGPSREEVKVSLGKDSRLLEILGDNLCFTGKLPHREALQKLAHSDYSILLRPDARYANAGFPTKLVESLSMGIPLICNLTSDIGMYIRDGFEGIVVKDCSPEAFAEGVKRALSMSLDERASMRVNAKKCAELFFDYRNWSTSLGVFVDTVISYNAQKYI